MKEKILALNSGGFDSVVLLHELKRFKEEEIVSLFFDYGQLNIKQELESAKKVANKLNIEFKVIKLSKFEWCNDSPIFNYTENKEVKQYIPMRNLIFLSYALSFAEKEGIKEIYVAFINAGNEQPFKDTSKDFLENLNKIASTIGIEIKAPFKEKTKFDLGVISKDYPYIVEGNYFSCNLPKENGEPCGKCGDCLILNRIKEDLYDCNIPIKAWLRSDNSFSKLFMENKISEIRILNTDICQFNCKHCFYGFDKMKEEQLSIEEYKNIIDQANKLGVKKLHFSGREPLCDENIFEIMGYVKENYPKMTYDLVTNGVLVNKYIGRLENLDTKRICISIDNLKDLTIRPTVKSTINAIETVKKSKIPLEIFIDVHKNNKKDIKSIIEKLYRDYGAKDFLVRPVAPLGRGKNIKDILLTPKDVSEVYLELKSFDYDDLNIEFFFRMDYTEMFLSEDFGELSNDLKKLIYYEVPLMTNCLFLMPEFYCGRYEDQITLTPDGYVLGCPTEVSSPKYDKIAIGNVKDSSLEDLILQGKENNLKLLANRMKLRDKNKCVGCSGGCYHSFNCFKKK